MVLSVLQLAPCGEYILYDSDQKKGILAGTQEECFEWKHSMENAAQQTANRLYMDELREERLSMLITAGHTHQSATEFLKQQMPYLFSITL